MKDWLRWRKWLKQTHQMGKIKVMKQMKIPRKYHMQVQKKKMLVLTRLNRKPLVQQFLRIKTAKNWKIQKMKLKLR